MKNLGKKKTIKQDVNAKQVMKPEHHTDLPRTTNSNEVEDLSWVRKLSPFGVSATYAMTTGRASRIKGPIK
jgi:hypothetical protein